MDTLIAEPADAPNPAIASGLQSVPRWRGVGDPCRSAEAVRGVSEHEETSVGDFLTTDSTDSTDCADVFYPCHPCHPWF